MSFNEFISRALASACVHGPEIMIELAKAQDERNPVRRLERLREAQLLSDELKRDIDAAFADLQPKMQVVR